MGHIRVMTITKQFTVKNIQGWHARPCAVIVRTVSKYPDIQVSFSCPKRTSISASGTSIFQLMTLGINCGDSVTVTLTGENPHRIDRLIEVLHAIISQQDLDDL